MESKIIAAFNLDGTLIILSLIRRVALNTSIAQWIKTMQNPKHVRKVTEPFGKVQDNGLSCRLIRTSALTHDDPSIDLLPRFAHIL